MKTKAMIILVLLLATASLVAQELTLTYATEVVESFDDPDAQTWIVRGSKFATEGYPKMTYANTWPQTLFGRNWDGEDLRCLGIQAKFDRKGYNYIELIPVKEDADGNYVNDPIKIPGRAKYLDLWVWGSNYDFYLEVHVLDFRGVDHVLPLGSLKYQGWKNLNVTIPSSIPQVDVHLPKYKNVELTKLVVWTRPAERVDDFYIYFDHIKVLTDLFQDRFDGDELIDNHMLDQIWDETSQQEE